jgi:hypothetical protein
MKLSRTLCVSFVAPAGRASAAKRANPAKAASKPTHYGGLGRGGWAKEVTEDGGVPSTYLI